MLTAESIETVLILYWYHINSCRAAGKWIEKSWPCWQCMKYLLFSHLQHTHTRTERDNQIFVLFICVHLLFNGPEPMRLSLNPWIKGAFLVTVTQHDAPCHYKIAKEGPLLEANHLCHDLDNKLQRNFSKRDFFSHGNHETLWNDVVQKNQRIFIVTSSLI